MTYDLYTAFPCTSINDIEGIVRNKNLNVATRIQLLAAALATGEQIKNFARVGDKGQDGGYKSLIFHDKPENTPYAQKLIADEQKRMGSLGLLQPSQPDLSLFPLYTTFIQFTFTLAAPYISRDDEPFHINDNPVKKDKVFNVPMVAPAGWKGALRSSMTHLLVQEWQSEEKQEQQSEEEQERQRKKKIETLAEDRFRLTWLFGDEKGEAGEESSKTTDLAEYLDKQLGKEVAQLYRHKVRSAFKDDSKTLPHHAGCLHFYPTFFDSIGMEVINPHDRATGTGKLPIYFECVPIGATGTFSLLYVPMPTTTAQDVATDMTLLARGIAAMLTTYGFGAKTSSGYGVAENELNGQGTLKIRADVPSCSSDETPPPSQSQSQPQTPKAPSKYQDPSGQLLAELRRDDGTLKSEEEYQHTIEQQGKQYKRSDKQLYVKAAKWWKDKGQDIWQQQQQAGPEPEPEPEPAGEQDVSDQSKPPVATCSFNAFDRLLQEIEGIAKELRAM